MTMKMRVLAALLLSLPVGRAAAAPGTITGRVEIPEPLLQVLRSQGYASLYRQASESPKGVALLEEFVVYLEKVPGVWSPVARRNVIHHRAQHFLPRTLPLLKGETVAFVNDDPYDHPLKSFSVLNPPFKNLLKAGGRPYLLRPLKTEEIAVSCDAHLKSQCFILVLQNPFFARVGREGSFTLKNVPPGAYVLKVWHPDLLPVAMPVKVAAGRGTSVDLILEKARYAP